MTTTPAEKSITTPKKEVSASLAQLLRDRKDSIAQLIPKHMDAERLMRVAVNCVQKTPGLQGCTPTSLLQCVLAAAEVGLEPGGALGQFYLVPFGTVATPIIGYRGLLELARRTGQIASIRAVVVYEKDTFAVEEGIEQRISHKRYLDGDPGAMRFVYAIAVLTDGSVQMELMTKVQVDAIRARSRAGTSGPWVTDYDEMAKKTVFRRLAKWLPLASERFERAIEMDNESYVDGDVVQSNAAVASELVNTKERVKNRRMMIVDEGTLPDEVPPPSSTPPPPAGDSTN